MGAQVHVLVRGSVGTQALARGSVGAQVHVLAQGERGCPCLNEGECRVPRYMEEHGCHVVSRATPTSKESGSGCYGQLSVPASGMYEVQI